MKLREFLTKYKIDRTKFACDCDIPYSTLMSYLSGKVRPKLKVAQKIAYMSDNLVTVDELRGGYGHTQSTGENVEPDGGSGKVSHYTQSRIFCDS